MKKHIIDALHEGKSALENLLTNETALENIQFAAEAMIQCVENNGHIFSCGNGGSMCDAMHFAEELSGRFRFDRKGIGAIAISDPGHISCVSNDLGYESIFSRYVQSHARKGDVLLAISTSGSSKNIIKAIEQAKTQEVLVVSLTGKKESKVGMLSDYEICTPGGMFADRVQELHIKVIHILIELIERKLFPENYRAI